MTFFPINLWTRDQTNLEISSFIFYQNSFEISFVLSLTEYKNKEVTWNMTFKGNPTKS